MEDVKQTEAALRDGQPAELPMWVQHPLPANFYIEAVPATFVTSLTDDGVGLKLYWRTANNLAGYVLSLPGVEHLGAVLRNSAIEMHRLQAQHAVGELVVAEKQLLGVDGNPIGRT